MKALHVLIVLCSSLAPMQASVYWIPGAANQTSAAGTPFVTEVHVTNLSSATANVQISWLPAGVSSAPPPPAAQTLAAGGTLSLTDAVSQLWSLSESSGAIAISADQPVQIAASRHTAASAPASFGSDLPVIATEDFLTDGMIGDALWVSDSGDPSSGFSTRFQVYLADAMSPPSCVFTIPAEIFS
jgi:hypothetical protein